MGLNHMGPLINTFFFPVVNISVIQDLDLVEFTDVKEWIWMNLIYGRLT